MIKVGFQLGFRNTKEWIGGINYYYSLLEAIMDNSERKIEPVIFVGTKEKIPLFQDVQELEIIKTRLLNNYPTRLYYYVFHKLSFNSWLFERALKRENISVVSHVNQVKKYENIPRMGWIPDFQHKYLNEYFSAEEIWRRDRDYQSLCEKCSSVIFSSQTAKRDAEHFFPQYTHKFRVLHFAPRRIVNIEKKSEVLEKFRVFQPYILVPNQFWIHKNHIVILKALSELKRKGEDILVISTGHTDDPRNPEYSKIIKRYIEDHDIGRHFKMLGVVSYSDLIQLMINSSAIINPSLFEGWSTTVEEAKALGLRLLLSDIPVHREQSPDRGHFFDPYNAEGLADIMQSVMDTSESNFDPSRLLLAQKTTENNRMIFAQQYEKLVLESVNL